MKFLDGYKSLIGGGIIMIAALLDVFSYVDAAGMFLKAGGAVIGVGIAHKLDKLVKLLTDRL